MEAKKNLKKIQSKLPQKSGVYLFLNAKKNPIYIGKAKDLRKRTAYYFREDLPKRLLKMVSLAENLEYFVTDSEHDAFLLEAQLIKEKKPIFNILYQNGRALYYINFSEHEFQRIQITHEWSKNAIGPFISVEYIKNLLNELLKIFKIRICTDYVFKIRRRPCLEFFANRCSGPCVGMINQQDYAKNVQKMRDLLAGNVFEIVQDWKSELKSAIKAENFELAAKKRDQLLDLEKLSKKQAIFFDNIKRLDIIIQNGPFFYVECLENGGIKDIIYRKYEKAITMLEFLLEFYPSDPKFPIIGSHELKVAKMAGFEQESGKNKTNFGENLESHGAANLSEFEEGSATFGDFERKNSQIVEQINYKNGETFEKKENFAIFKTYSKPKIQLHKKIFQAACERMNHLLARENVENDCAKILGVKNLQTIEVYDSAHYGGKNARCGMVFFDFSKNDFVKKNYRTWKVPNSRNDLEILKNALERRKMAGNLPSMILLDGGLTQLKVAKMALFPYDSIFAFAKGANRRGGNLYDYEENLILSSEKKFENIAKISGKSGSEISGKSGQNGSESEDVGQNCGFENGQNSENINEKNSNENLLLFLEKLRTTAHNWVNRTTSNDFTKTFVRPSKKISKKSPNKT